MKSIKKIGLIAMALGAFAPTTKAEKTNNGIVISKTEATAKPIQGTKQMVVKEDAGGFQVMEYGYGKPPKWYGENIVRRGTHKRLNKRK